MFLRFYAIFKAVELIEGTIGYGTSFSRETAAADFQTRAVRTKSLNTTPALGLHRAGTFEDVSEIEGTTCTITLLSQA